VCVAVIVGYLFPPKKSVQWLHTSMKPLHRFFGEPPKSWHFCRRNRGVVCPDVNKNLINMTKADIEKKKSLARTLYLSGMEQQEIAEKVDVSRVTISKWCSSRGVERGSCRQEHHTP